MTTRLASVVRTLRERVRSSTASKPASAWAGYTSDALQLASIIDCAAPSLLTRQQHPERIAPAPSDRICHWYLPYFDNPFYGGIMTILRLAEYLHRRYGMRQRFLICGAAAPAEMSARIAAAFPALASAEVLVLDSGGAIQRIPPSDYSIATLWTTAYVLLDVSNTGCKFYMVQDFEPAFYPAGSTYAQAELSYYFGFHGICNTQTLKDIYETQYGGSAIVLEPTIDRSVFYPTQENKASSPRRIFYYARPGTPRNGFELAASALKKLKSRYGADLDIVCAGTGWDPDDYGLGDVVRTVGLLPYTATGDLYRSCHAGFVMMMTKHPSYLPLELMACGATVVTNFNPANSWLLKDGENCLLSPPSATCLASTLAYALDQHESLAPLRKNAEQLVASRGDWDNSMEAVAAFMLAPPARDKHELFGERFTALAGAHGEA